MTIMVGSIYVLNNGYFFKVDTIRKSIPGIKFAAEAWGDISFGNNCMRGYMDLLTGNVYEILTHSLVSTYTSPPLLPYPFIMSEPNPIETVTCECGGFATYNSMDPLCHSGWCAVNKQKEVRSGWIKYHI